MEGFRFWTEIAVRFAETDAQGVAHNATYLVWFEVARIEYLARFRGGYKSLQADGYEALTTESHVRYLQPVFFDDRIKINARCVDVRGARFRYEYAIERDGDADGALVVCSGFKSILDLPAYTAATGPEGACGPGFGDEVSLLMHVMVEEVAELQAFHNNIAATIRKILVIVLGLFFNIFYLAFFYL
jgi:acyl-CoA thioester hydrolase